MADTKITQLQPPQLGYPVVPATDVLPIVVIADPGMATSGSTRKVTVNQLLGAGGTATLASATITGALTVNGLSAMSGAFGGNYGLTLTNTTNNAAGFLRIGGTGTGGGGEIDFYNGSTAWGGIKCVASSQLDFLSSSFSTLMTLNSTGLGVGVSPSASWVTYKPLEFDTGIVSGSSSMALNRNTYFDGVNWRYKVTTSFGVSQYQLSGNGNHIWNIASSGSAGAAINGGTGSWTQAMTLDATKNLSVNTTAYVGVGTGVINSTGGLNIVPDNTGSASNRNWQLAANGSAAGNLDFTVSSANNTYPNSAYRMQLTSAGALNNTTGTYGTISDLRLKENISDARNYLADLLKLRVVKYSLKEESSAVATKLGFIAQEVEQVFPNLVDQSDVAYDGGEGIRSVKTSILIPMLLKAIQELTARVEALEA